MNLNQERLDYWNSRATLGFAAGSGDTNLKKLEIKAIKDNIGEAKYILDAGCGNAVTITTLAKNLPESRFVGFDYADEMVEEGLRLIESLNLTDRIKILRGNLLGDLVLPEDNKLFECIYTERSIINLSSFDEQLKSIMNLWKWLAPKGKLILCESFTDGLCEINSYRRALGLKIIEKPWHNRYLSISELDKISDALMAPIKIFEFSGSYYFTSRVLHAKEACDAETEPSYDAPINLISLLLPPLPVCGQSKLVIFDKI